MLPFFRVFPLGGIELLMAPILVLIYGAPALRPWAALAFVLIAIPALITLRARIRLGNRERSESLAEQAGWAWDPSFTAEDYRIRLKAFLQGMGWRVVANDVAGEDVVWLHIRNDRCIAAMLCVRPGVPTGDADLRKVIAMRAAIEAGTHAVLITSTPRVPGTAPEPGVMQLAYEDLPELGEALGIQIVYAEYSR